MTENPERLIAWRVKRYSLVLTHGPAFAAEAALLGDAPSCPEEVLYVRADIAAAEKAALVAERDALRALARRAADFIGQPVFRLTVDGQPSPRTVLWDDIDAALSGKGVG